MIPQIWIMGYNVIYVHIKTNTRYVVYYVKHGREDDDGDKCYSKSTIFNIPIKNSQNGVSSNYYLTNFL